MKWDNQTFKTEFKTVGAPQADSHTIMDDAQPVGLSSPGKRKYDESSLSYQDYGVTVSERELRGSDDSYWNAGPAHDPFAPNGSKQHEVIVGIDPSLGINPSLLTKHYDDTKAKQEMEERSGIPMLSGRPMSKEKAATIDEMDLDQVVEDANIREESAAVKRVGFADGM